MHSPSFTHYPELYLASYPVISDTRTAKNGERGIKGSILGIHQFAYVDVDETLTSNPAAMEEIFRVNDSPDNKVSLKVKLHDGKIQSATYDFYRVYLFPFSGQKDKKYSVDMLQQYGWRLDYESIDTTGNARYPGSIVIERRTFKRNDPISYPPLVDVRTGWNHFAISEESFQVFNLVTVFSENVIDSKTEKWTDDDVTAVHYNQWYTLHQLEIDKLEKTPEKTQSFAPYQLKEKGWKVSLSLAYTPISRDDQNDGSFPQPGVARLKRCLTEDSAGKVEIEGWEPVPLLSYTPDNPVQYMTFPVEQASAYTLIKSKKLYWKTKR